MITVFFFFFQAEDGIRDIGVTGVQTCALPIYPLEQRLLNTGLRSFCIVPLILEGKSIGTLGIGSDQANQYSEADADFLCEVAGQVALAAGNMKSYEEIANLKTRLEKENVYLQ